MGAVAVTDAEGGLLGIITDGDLRRMLEKYEDVDGLKARDICRFLRKLFRKKNSLTTLSRKWNRIVSLNWWSWTKIKNTREWFISTIYWEKG